MAESEIESLRRELRDLIEVLGGFRGEVSSTIRYTRELGDAAEGSADEISAEADMRRAQAEVDKKDNEAKRNRSYALDRAYQDSETAVKSLTKTFISGEAGFAKYNSGISSAGDAAWNFGKSLGPLGAVLGAVVKGATMVAESALKQADNLLKASDQISKMGAANAFSTEQIRMMGAGAGLASDQLDKMLKPLASMGGGLTVLGSTSTEGVKRFSEMIAVTKKTREEFQRLGLNDEERIQAQADFVDMLYKSGSGMQGSLKTQKGLQEASLAYTKSLYEMSAITGKDIEASKKQMEIDQASYAWKLQENKWARDTAAAAARGDTEEVKRIEAQKNAMTKLLHEVGMQGDEEQTAAFAQRLLTGTVSDLSARFDIKGQNVDKFIAEGKQGIYNQGELLQELNTKQQGFVDRVGHTVLALDESFAKTSGSSAAVIEATTRSIGRDMPAAFKDASDKIAANEQGKGAAAEDPAQIARNALTEAERSAKLALDDLLASINPLVNGFNTLSTGLTMLTGAAMVAAGALGAKSVGSAAGGALGNAGLGGKIGFGLGAGALLAGGLYLISEKEKSANKELDESVAAKDKQIQQSANDEYTDALKDTGWSYDLSKGGLLDPKGKHVTTAEAPENVRAIANAVYEKRRVKVTAKDKGGPIKPGEISLVGEFGPELLAGPGMVTSRKDTEAILMKAMQGVNNPRSNPSNQVFSTATMRTQQLTKERKLRDLMEEKEVELDQVASLNMTLGILNDSAIELSEVFYEVEEQLRSIFGTEELDEPADPTTIVDKVKEGLDKLFGGGGTGEGSPPVVPSDMSNLKNPEKIKAAMDYFKKQGWSREQSAGILGNLMAESGRDLATNAVGDGGKAFGIAQWHPDRQAKFKEVFGKDIRQSTLEEQLAFVNWELKNTERKAGGVLSQARSGAQAAAMVDKFYERSSGAHRGKRMSYAEGILQTFSDSDVQVAAATTTSGATAEAMKGDSTAVPATGNKAPAIPVVTTASTDTAQSMNVNAQLLDTLSTKLDTMIAKLDDSNSIQEKILRQSA